MHMQKQMVSPVAQERSVSMEIKPLKCKATLPQTSKNLIPLTAETGNMPAGGRSIPETSKKSLTSFSHQRLFFRLE